MSAERDPEALGMAGRAKPGGEEAGCKEPSGHIGAFREWKYALSSLGIKAYICIIYVLTHTGHLDWARCFPCL